MHRERQVDGQQLALREQQHAHINQQWQQQQQHWKERNSALENELSLCKTQQEQLVASTHQQAVQVATFSARLSTAEAEHGLLLEVQKQLDMTKVELRHAQDAATEAMHTASRLKTLQAKQVEYEQATSDLAALRAQHHQILAYAK